MYDVITFGSSTRDVFVKVKDGGFKVIEESDFVTNKGICYPLGSKVEVEELIFSPGGGGVNSAATFARQGLNTAAIGVLCDDIGGNEILKFLKNEGVDTKMFIVSEGGSGTAYSLVLFSSSGERTILTYKGEGKNFDENKIKWDEVESKWFYVDSLGGNLDLLAKIVEVAKKKGIKVAINPGGKTLEHGLDALKPYLDNIDVFAVNKEEAARLTGIDYKNEKEIFKFMDKIVKGIFIMTKGPEGAVVSDGQKIYRVSATKGKAVERTGAGDSFNSGFVAGYIDSENIEEALKLAIANAENVVSHIGATKGILKKGDMGEGSLPEVTVEEL